MRNEQLFLDSSAVLALVRNEPGAEAVEEVLAHSCPHTIHRAEIARKLRSLDLSTQEIEIMITDLQIPLLKDLTVREAMLAASYADVKHLGLSLADRICLSIARHRELDVVTADRKWAQVRHEQRIMVIR